MSYAAELALGKATAGRIPDDLPALLALVALAGPATCGLRALAYTLSVPLIDPNLRHSAGRIAWGFRSLFNTPEVIALVRGMNGASLIGVVCSNTALPAACRAYSTSTYTYWSNPRG